MNHNQTCRRRRPRRGFTIIEATIVTTFMAFLAMLIGATWAAFVRPTADIADRCRIAQEANLAVAALSQDLAGTLADDHSGIKDQYALVGRTQPGNTQLRLCFDGGTTPDGTASWSSPDYVITYYVSSNNLIRWNENASTTFVVARDVSAFQVVDLGNKQVRITLTFTYNTLTRTYTLIARDP